MATKKKQMNSHLIMWQQVIKGIDSTVATNIRKVDMNVK